MMRLLSGALLTLAILLSSVSAAKDEQEDAFPEEAEEQAASDLPLAPLWQNILINGKFDAVFDVAGKDHVRTEQSGIGRHTFANWDNYHTFLFLNVRVAPKTVFLGTIYVGPRHQYFFNVERTLSRTSKLVFGEILVPFGRNPFHKFYGGVGGYQFESKIIPNIWSEPGVSLHYRSDVTRDLQIEGDTYAVRRSIHTDPGVVLSERPSAVTGVGQWLRLTLFAYSSVWLSGFYDTYYGEIGEDLDELLVGVDVFHTFQWTDVPFLKTVELTAGFARLNRDDAFDFSDFRNRRYGDYVQLTVRQWDRFVRPNLRYGSFAADPTAPYDPQNPRTGVKREHHLVATVLIPDGNLSYLIQYQRNWEDMRPEAVGGELKDDLIRVELLFEF